MYNENRKYYFSEFLWFKHLKFEVIGVFIKLIENNAKFTIAANPHKLKETYD